MDIVHDTFTVADRTELIKQGILLERLIKDVGQMGSSHRNTREDVEDRLKVLENDLVERKAQLKLIGLIIVSTSALISFLISAVLNKAH